MNKNRKPTFFAVIITCAAAVALIQGCGGGGGSQSTSPAGTGKGKVAASVKMTGRAAGKTVALSATQTVTVTITISGIYGVDGSEFTPVTNSATFELSQERATVSMMDVPVGVNHLMVAVADWGAATETVKAIIPDVKDGEVTTVSADAASTVVADTVVYYAEQNDKTLPDIPAEMIAAIQDAVDTLASNGTPFSQMQPAAVLTYIDTMNVPASVTVSPITAEMFMDGSAQFTAGVLNANNIAIPGATVTWSFTNPGVGSVDSNGLFTPLGVGTGSVVAAHGAISASATVTVLVSVPALSGSIPGPTGTETFLNLVLNEDKTKMIVSDMQSGFAMIYDFNQGMFNGLAQINPLSLYLEKAPNRNAAYSMTADICGIYAGDEITCSSTPLCRWNAETIVCETDTSQAIACNFNGVCDAGENAAWCPTDCQGLDRRAGRKSKAELKREARLGSPADIKFYLGKIDLDTGARSAMSLMDMLSPSSGFLFSDVNDSMYYLALVGTQDSFTAELRKFSLSTFTQTLAQPTTRLTSSTLVGMAVDDQSGTLFVPDETENKIYKYDLATLQELGPTSISLGGASLLDISAHRHGDGNLYLYAAQNNGFFVYNVEMGSQLCSFSATSLGRESMGPASAVSVVGVYEPFHQVYIYDSNSSSLLVIDATTCTEVANLGNINMASLAYNESTKTVYLTDGSSNIYIVSY